MKNQIDVLLGGKNNRTIRFRQFRCIDPKEKGFAIDASRFGALLLRWLRTGNQQSTRNENRDNDFHGIPT